VKTLCLHGDTKEEDGKTVCRRKPGSVWGSKTEAMQKKNISWTHRLP